MVQTQVCSVEFIVILFHFACDFSRTCTNSVDKFLMDSKVLPLIYRMKSVYISTREPRKFLQSEAQQMVLMQPVLGLLAAAKWTALCYRKTQGLPVWQNAGNASPSDV